MVAPLDIFAATSGLLYLMNNVGPECYGQNVSLSNTHVQSGPKSTEIRTALFTNSDSKVRNMNKFIQIHDKHNLNITV